MQDIFLHSDCLLLGIEGMGFIRSSTNLEHSFDIQVEFYRLRIAKICITVFEIKSRKLGAVLHPKAIDRAVKENELVLI